MRERCQNVKLPTGGVFWTSEYVLVFTLRHQNSNWRTVNTPELYFHEALEQLRTNISTNFHFDRGRISSVGRAFDCRAEGRGFDSRGRTITQGLKTTEKWRYFLCTASGETFAWLGWPRKMAVPSPVGYVKIVSPISTFVLNTLTIK